MKEGDKGGSFYILLKGKCVVLRRNIPLTRIDKKGIIFGEKTLV